MKIFEIKPYKKFLGTPEERGLIQWKAQFTDTKESSNQKDECYDLPFGMNYLRNSSWTQYVPFLPTYRGFTLKSRKKVAPSKS